MFWPGEEFQQELWGNLHMPLACLFPLQVPSGYPSTGRMETGPLYSIWGWLLVENCKGSGGKQIKRVEWVTTRGVALSKLSEGDDMRQLELYDVQVGW